jgi:hypothetical protein
MLYFYFVEKLFLFLFQANPLFMYMQTNKKDEEDGFRELSRYINCAKSKTINNKRYLKRSLKNKEKLHYLASNTLDN